MSYLFIAIWTVIFAWYAPKLIPNLPRFIRAVGEAVAEIWRGIRSTFRFVLTFEDDGLNPFYLPGYELFGTFVGWCLVIFLVISLVIGSLVWL